MEIVWLASYPKSGNTWVRFLFTNLIHGPFADSQTIFDVTPVLERGVDPAKLCSDRVNLIKTHYMCAKTLPYMDQARGAVYIVRNPFDVMMSNLNYVFLTSGATVGKSPEEIQEMSSRYVTAYLHNGGDQRWRKVNYGSWQEHVASWTRNSLGLPVKAIRYEDLLADTAGTLRAVCDFISFDIDDEALRRALDASRFERMREMEERELREKRTGMFYSPGQASANGHRFMNRGKSGVAAEALTPQVIEQFRSVFAPQIEEFGYA